MQSALSTWEGIVQATGGALAPDKSWWYLVDFVWVNGTWKLSDKGEGLDLVAHDKDENEISLTYLMSSEAQQMLGVYSTKRPIDNSTQLHA